MRRDRRPTMRQFCCSLLAFCTLLSCATQVRDASGEDQRPPNIIYIMADDLGIGDVACYGQERCQIPTPHMDRLAREGMTFTDAHAVASVCIPSRLAIMTGRYPWRFRPPETNGPWGFINPYMRPREATLGTLLKGQGYRTGYVGKWHLGLEMATRDGAPQDSATVDFTLPVKQGPLHYGFDECFILPGSLDMYPYAFVRGDSWVGEVTAQKGWSAFNRVGPAETSFKDDQVLSTFCDEAEAFLERQSRDREGPFFLYLALTSPHTPVSPSEEFRGKSPLGPYGDFVMETDACVGRVLRALDRLNLADDTLVIATSDHGPAPYAGPRLKATAGQVRELEAQGHFPSGHFRGYKFSVYEGGLRVPFLVRWPGVVESGSSCDALVGLIDLFATVADIVDVDLREDQAVDSISFLPLLKQPRSSATRSHLVLQSPQAFVIRQGPWKLALCPGSGCRGHLGNRPGRQEAWAAAIAAFGRVPRGDEVWSSEFVQLFQLEKDPTESEDLAAQSPDRLKEMVRLLQSIVDRGRSTAGPDQRNDRERISIAPRVLRPVPGP